MPRRTRARSSGATLPARRPRGRLRRGLMPLPYEPPPTPGAQPGLGSRDRSVPGAQTYPNGLGLLGSSAMATITAYGEWISPISAQALTANVRRLSSPTVVGDEIWWSEDRPAEGGRLTVMARRGDGALVELLPAPWNARSRVHEYGGRSYLPVPGPDSPGLVFVHFPDQRLYRLDPGAQAPVPLTPAPTEDTAPRYADLVLTGSEVLCVRERHHRDGLDRHVVAVPLDGSAADAPAAVREVVGGSHFLANPRP